MKKLMFSMGGATIVGLAIAATALAAGPAGGAGQGARNGADGAAGTMIPAILDLTPAEVQELRQSGLTLAQIAERQDVDPEVLVDALTARWTARIEARVAAGALTADEAAALQAQVELRARDMVNKVPLGGMRGLAVGAGAGRQDGMGARGGGNGAGNGAANGFGAGGGRGAGNGACDGTGRGVAQP